MSRSAYGAWIVSKKKQRLPNQNNSFSNGTGAIPFDARIPTQNPTPAKQNNKRIHWHCNPQNKQIEQNKNARFYPVIGSYPFGRKSMCVCVCVSPCDL